jgi:GMP synthase PP-ATPase subunit
MNSLILASMHHFKTLQTNVVEEISKPSFTEIQPVVLIVYQLTSKPVLPDVSNILVTVVQ